jgi:hypothetical protein
LYGFVGNNSINSSDRLGLILTKSNGEAIYTYSSLPLNVPAGTEHPKFQINPKITEMGAVSKLVITGKLPQMRVILNSERNDLGPVRDAFGNNVGEHEKVHVDTWKDSWNALRDNLSSLDGDYCPSECASIAADSANIIKDMFYSNARIINASFDLVAYPDVIAQTPGEKARLNSIIDDHKNKIKEGENKLRQQEQKWISKKCTKR